MKLVELMNTPALNYLIEDWRAGKKVWQTAMSRPSRNRVFETGTRCWKRF